MRKGFTLVEIMIVVGIIALLAGIAIPNLLRARLSAQESAAVSAMHALVAAQVQYRVTHSNYSALGALDDDAPPYIDSNLALGSRHGYTFTVAGISPSQFYATAASQVTSAHSFYIDENGVLCRSNATNTSVPTSHSASDCPSGFSQME